jgi:predicted nuclease with TOPRIM domain
VNIQEKIKMLETENDKLKEKIKELEYDNAEYQVKMTETDQNFWSVMQSDMGRII